MKDLVAAHHDDAHQEMIIVRDNELQQETTMIVHDPHIVVAQDPSMDAIAHLPDHETMLLNIEKSLQ